MPAGGALFGSSATGPGSTGGNKHLIEVRAGKMNLKGKATSLVTHCHCLNLLCIRSYGVS